METDDKENCQILWIVYNKSEDVVTSLYHNVIVNLRDTRNYDTRPYIVLRTGQLPV